MTNLEDLFRQTFSDEVAQAGISIRIDNTDQRIVSPFIRAFDRLWDRMTPYS